MKMVFNGAVCMKIVNSHLITTYNKDTNEFNYFYYDNQEFFFDTVRLNIVEFEEKYKDYLFSLNYQMLKNPKALLVIYSKSDITSESKALYFHDSLENVLIANHEWSYDTADIIIVRKEFIIDVNV